MKPYSSIPLFNFPLPRLLLMFTLLAGLSSISAADEVTVETALGEVSVTQSPEVIAVYDMAAIDSLSALNITIQGIPQPVLLPRLQYLTETAEDIGTLFEPDLEALSALNPDLIIIGGRSSAQRESLSRLAPVIDMTIRGEHLYDDAVARITAYGKIFDKESEAAGLLETLENKIAETRQTIRQEETALLLMTNGPKVSAYGSQSRFGWIHDTLDIPEAVENIAVAGHGEAVSFEFVRDANPAWLLVIDRSGAIGNNEQSAQATLDNELVADTEAWKKNQVIYLPAAEAYIAGGGYHSMIETLDVIAGAYRKSADNGIANSADAQNTQLADGR